MTFVSEFTIHFSNQRPLLLPPPCRLWPAPLPFRLLHSAAPANRQRQCFFEAFLLAPTLAFCFDHRVQGRPLLPGSALFEAALAAGASLLASSAAPHSGTTAAALQPQVLAVVDCSIPSPVALGASAAGMALRVEASLGSGSLAVRSVRSRATHLAGHWARVAQGAGGPGPSAAEAGDMKKSRQHAASPALAGLLAAGRARTLGTVGAAHQIAGITVDPLVHGDGYQCHPAIVDSCLHTGASLAPTSAGTEQQQPTVRVPVGVQAFLAGTEFKPFFSELSAHGRLTALGGASSSAVSSYAVRQGATAHAAAAAAVVIAGLEARPISLPPASIRLQVFPAAAPQAQQQQPGAAQEPEPELLYEVQWEASSKAHFLLEAPGVTAGAPQPAISVVAASHGRAAMANGNSSRKSSFRIAGAEPPAAALGKLLAGLQTIVRQGAAGRSVRLATLAGMAVPAAATGPGPQPLQLPAAAAWGMARVAASEAPDAAWSAVDLDAAAHSSGSAAGEAADVSGSAVKAGLLLRPMLAAAGMRAAVESAVAADPIGLSGRVVVTGGLGG